jgi:uncharacterized protein with von Willebrand factor type A (vWA) domain
MSGVQLTADQQAMNAHTAQRGRPVPSAITLIVDRSASMGGHESEVTNSVHTFINKQKDLRGSAIFTLAEFADDYRVLDAFKNKEIKQIDASKFHYNPNGGGTAIRNAIVEAIKDMDNYLKEVGASEQPQPKKVIIGLITDGDDNASSWENSVEKVCALIKEKLKAGWNFLFLGSDESTLRFAKEHCIPEDTTAVYSADKPNAAIDLMSEKVKQARSGKAMRITAEERLALGDGTKKKDL